MIDHNHPNTYKFDTSVAQTYQAKPIFSNHRNALHKNETPFRLYVKMYRAVNLLAGQVSVTATKEQYDKWVSDWKLTYKNLSQISKFVKQLRKTSMISSFNERDSETILEIANKRADDVEEFRKIANTLLNLRHTFKNINEGRYQLGVLKA